VITGSRSRRSPPPPLSPHYPVDLSLWSAAERTRLGNNHRRNRRPPRRSPVINNSSGYKEAARAPEHPARGRRLFFREQTASARTPRLFVFDPVFSTRPHPACDNPLGEAPTWANFAPSRSPVSMIPLYNTYRRSRTVRTSQKKRANLFDQHSSPPARSALLVGGRRGFAIFLLFTALAARCAFRPAPPVPNPLPDRFPLYGYAISASRCKVGGLRIWLVGKGVIL